MIDVNLSTIDIEQADYNESWEKISLGYSHFYLSGIYFGNVSFSENQVEDIENPIGKKFNKMTPSLKDVLAQIQTFNRD